MLDITQPMQFREPHYGTIIDVILNPNGEENSTLIVNLLRDKKIYTAFRYNTGELEAGKELDGDIVNVLEKKKYAFWIYYWSSGKTSTATVELFKIGDIINNDMHLVAKEFVEKEINV